MTRKATPKALSDTPSDNSSDPSSAASSRCGKAPEDDSPLADALPLSASMAESSGDGWLVAAIDAHQAALVLYVTRIVGNLETARDVVQDAFLRLLQQDRASIESHLAEWLYTVCRNRALDMKRKNNRMQLLPDETASALAHQSSGPAAAVEQAETVSRMLRLLERLPKNQQEVIRLKFQAGLSYHEISRVTRLSVSNVGFLLHMGLKTLRQRMKED